jgi:hypothetical protein
VDQAEERALVHAAAVDVEGRVNVLLHQLDALIVAVLVGSFSFLSFPLSIYSPVLLSNQD